MDVNEALREFRKFAWSQSAAFGRGVDQLLLTGAGLGDAAATSPGAPPTATTSALDRLSSGLASLAAATNLSLKSYFDAMTMVNQMRAAHAAGVPVDTYIASTSFKNQATSLISDPSSPTFNVLGVPLWVILGGVALLMVVRR